MNNNKPILIRAFCIFTIFWALFIFTTKTYNSGYHFVDDHEIIRINNDLRQNGYFRTLNKWIKNDINNIHRFRPSYYLFRISETYVFKTDFRAWSLFHLSMAIITSFLFFYFAFKLYQSQFEAYIFTALSLLGTQSAIWWRLGPSEFLGALSLSISLFSIIKSVTSPKHKILYQILFIVSSLTMALSKESFLIIIPSLILLKVYCDIIFKPNNKKVTCTSILSILSLSIIFVYGILFIKYKIGTMTGIGYAGVDKSSLLNFILTFRSILNYADLKTTILFFIFVTIALPATNTTNLIKNFWSILNNNILIIVSIVLIFIFQSFLYAKSGITVDRYIFPTTVGIGLVAIFMLSYLRKNKFPFWQYVLISGLIIKSLIPLSGIAYANAKLYTNNNAPKIIDRVTEYIEPANNIYIISDNANYELAFSIKTFLQFNKKYSNINICGLQNINNQNIYQCKSDLDDPFSLVLANELSKIDNIILLPDQKEVFFDISSTWFSDKNYRMEVFDNYIFLTNITPS